MVYLLLSLSALLMLTMPIILSVWIVRRYHVGWKLFFIGAAGFVVSQIGHIPFNQFVLNPLVERLLTPEKVLWAVLLVSLLLGLSAGIFEEVTRYIFYRIMKNTRTWRQGLLFGAGWGGIESIILSLVVLSTVANVYIYQNGLIESFVSPEQMSNNSDAVAAMATQVEELMAAPWWKLLFGAVERVFTITIQICLSILVLQAFIRDSILWLFTAIAWHIVIDAVAVFATLQEWDALLIEAAIAPFALASLFIILWLKPSVDPEVV